MTILIRISVLLVSDITTSEQIEVLEIIANYSKERRKMEHLVESIRNP